MRPRRAPVLCLLAALALSACGSEPVTPTTTPSLSAVTEAATLPDATTPTPVPSLGIDAAALSGISLRVWHAYVGAANDVFTRQVAQFNATNEWGIVINSTGYGDYPSLFDAVSTALDSGQPPDLVVALPEQTLTWADSGSVVDLNPYIGDPAWGLETDALADIPSVFLAQDNVNGQQLGLPAQRSARFLFYNETWAHELGFDSPPATADEFRQQACAANTAYRKDTDPTNDGYGGWIVDTHWQTAYSWLLAFDGSAVDGDAYTFRSDPNLAALQFLKKMFDDHCAWLSIEPTPFDSFARRSALFVTGDLAEVVQETDSMSRLKNSDEWTIIPFPGPQENDIVAYGPSYTILKSTLEKQLAAWLLVRWLLSPENQAQWVEATGLFPLRSSLHDMIGPFRSNLPQWDSAVGALSFGQTVPQLASWGDVRYLLEDGITVIFQVDTPVDQLSGILTEMDSMAGQLK